MDYKISIKKRNWMIFCSLLIMFNYVIISIDSLLKNSNLDDTTEYKAILIIPFLISFIVVYNTIKDYFKFYKLTKLSKMILIII